MNRRSLLAAIACLPIVGRFAKATEPRETIRIVNLDGEAPRVAVMDPYVQSGTVVVMGGVMFVPPHLAKRLPPPDAAVGVGERWFNGWDLQHGGRSLARLA